MNILRIIASLDPEAGGPAEGIRQLTRALGERGHRTEVACVDAPGAEWLENYTFPVHALGPAWTPWGYAPRLEPWLRDAAGRFDCVLVHGLHQYAGFAVWRTLRDRSTPYYVYPHGMLDPWFKRAHPLKHLKKQLFWPWSDYRLLRDARAVLFTTEEERRLARRSFMPYRCTEKVVGYGTRGVPAEGAGDARAFHRRHPKLEDARIVLFLSRIHPKKGCDLLIEAFARVFGDDSPWHLVMAGPDRVGWTDELQDQAERLGISDRVTWTGMVRDEIKWATFRSADVFALPSHQENFGIVVAEAMSCGVPVLTTRAVNTWREVVESGGGFADEDTPAGMVRLLERWRALSEEERRRMGERARGGFEDHFGVSRAADRLLATIGSNEGVTRTAEAVS